MSLSLIRAEYKSIISGVAGVGVVHDYARLATDWKKFLDLFKDVASGKILGWDISRESTPVVQSYLSGDSPSRVCDRQHVMLIRGYAGLQDSTGSQKTFDTLVDAVWLAILPLHDLNGKALVTTPPVVSLVTERDFGGVLCHYAEIRQSVWEQVTV
jgi:hypothetical protein